MWYNTEIMVTPQPKPCEQCGSLMVFENYGGLPIRRWKTKRFCSNQCAGLARRGQPNGKKGIPTKDLDERFWAKVDKYGPVMENMESACWVWIGSKSESNYSGLFYGSFYLDGKRVKAHRVSFELVKGPIGDLELDHLCRNTLCVNPDHLEPVTRSENVLRCDHGHRKKTHCPKGHEYTDANVYHPPNRPNVRHCRTCQAERQRQRQSFERHRRLERQVTFTTSTT